MEHAELAKRAAKRIQQRDLDMDIILDYHAGKRSFDSLPARMRKEAKRVNKHNNRAKKRGQPHTLILSEWLMLLMLHEWACRFCGATTCGVTMEHLLPISHGGGTTVYNCVPVCGNCNNVLERQH